jgi:thiol-disulfide isomerase/thioredoxin
MSVLMARAVRTWRQPALQIGSVAPPFTVTQQVTQQACTPVSLKSLRGRIVVVEFVGEHCGICESYASRASQFATRCAEAGDVAFVQIRSEQYPAIAESYQARTTPTFYVIDRDGRVQYCGAFDDNATEAKVRNRYVEDAVGRLREGEPVAISSTQAFGRSVKWPK